MSRTAGERSDSLDPEFHKRRRGDGLQREDWDCMCVCWQNQTGTYHQTEILKGNEEGGLFQFRSCFIWKWIPALNLISVVLRCSYIWVLVFSFLEKRLWRQGGGGHGARLHTLTHKHTNCSSDDYMNYNLLIYGVFFAIPPSSHSSSNSSVNCLQSLSGPSAHPRQNQLPHIFKSWKVSTRKINLEHENWGGKKGNRVTALMQTLTPVFLKNPSSRALFHKRTFIIQKGPVYE